jgi:hypothetical protein
MEEEVVFHLYRAANVIPNHTALALPIFQEFEVFTEEGE